MKQKILQWIKRAFKPRPWWRVVVSYDRGPALVWETREPWHLLHRHLPKLGERHGDQIVIQWEVRHF